jgi:hypothetical protein
MAWTGTGTTYLSVTVLVSEHCGSELNLVEEFMNTFRKFGKGNTFGISRCLLTWFAFHNMRQVKLLLGSKVFTWCRYIPFVADALAKAWLNGLGRDSSVGVATRYGLEGPGIEFRWE